MELETESAGSAGAGATGAGVASFGGNTKCFASKCELFGGFTTEVDPLFYSECILLQ